jgi:heterotetrameric sarcosine oxidase delta subunit
MRITCPHCGTRDRREFTWIGDAVALDRPARDAGPAAWESYIHLRDNPAGQTREIWYHDPCGAMIHAERDTVTHAFGRLRGLSGGPDDGTGDRSDRFNWDEGDLREIPQPGATT